MGIFDLFKVNQYKAEIQKLYADNVAMHQRLNELGAYDYYKIKEMIQALTTEYESKKVEFESNLNSLNQNTDKKSSELQKLEKNVRTQTNKLARSKELVKAIEYTLSNYFLYEPTQSSFKISEKDLVDIDEYSPSVILKLHCMDVKDLRKAYKENDKLITQVLTKYAARYTTKANQAIYQLMIVALRCELQNILYNLKFEKLDKGISNVKEMTSKYLSIAGSGNQSIAATLQKFIGEIEYLFINAVKIEYNYYVKKEQARQEQLAIREQMRQEAEERKALEVERKKIEKEEFKYTSEIEKLKEQLVSATPSDLDKLNARILELQSQLDAVAHKKEEISNLANGKAGNVYIISNLGSFGDGMFKIGMTRRLDPQDRVNELGDASVPFKFDVHSFIFSDDAVSLEGKLHDMLSSKRVNKVNLRKEFFYTSIDELEKLVTDIEPTADFNRTMLAEDYRQSLSSEASYSSDAIVSFDEE